MKRKAAWILGVFVFLLPAAFAYADVTSQFDQSRLVGHSSDMTWYLGTTTAPTTLSSVSLILSATSSSETVYARVTCFANTWSSSQTGCTNINPVQSLNSVGFSGDRVLVLMNFSTTLQTGKAYIIEVIGTDANVGFYGGTEQFGRQCNTIPFGNTCSSGTNLVPYFNLNQSIDWVGGLNLYTPSVFATSSAAIAASSSLWGAYASSSTLIEACNTGNLFGDGLCSAASFLFVPNPNTLNAFFSIPSAASGKFPFSWIYGVQTTFSSLAVSSTTAMTSLSFNLGTLGIGSTTPMGNILPNTEVFSKNTIETYISPTLWATFQTLIAAGMWLGFIWFEFNRARRMAKPH